MSDVRFMTNQLLFFCFSMVLIAPRVQSFRLMSIGHAHKSIRQELPRVMIEGTMKFSGHRSKLPRQMLKMESGNEAQRRGVEQVRSLSGYRTNVFSQIASKFPVPELGPFIPALALGVWLIIATQLFQRIENWQPGQAFFYVIDTGLCRGFGSVKPATMMGQVRSEQTFFENINAQFF